MQQVSITKLTGNKTYDRLATLSPGAVFRDGISNGTKAVYYAGYKRLIGLNLKGDRYHQAMAVLEQYKPAKREQVIHRDTLPTREAIEQAKKKAKPRYAALIALLQVTGCRISEALSITRASVERQTEGHYTAAIIGKGNKERRIIIPADVYTRLIETWGDGERIIPITRMAAYKAIKRLGFTPHKLRHVFGTAAIEAGISIDKVSKYMGHSSVDITAKYYLHGQVQASDIEKMRAA